MLSRPDSFRSKGEVCFLQKNVARMALAVVNVGEMVYICINVVVEIY